MRRLVIAALALGLAGLSSPAEALDKVGPEDLPTAEQAAAIYPALAGGSREEPLKHRRVDGPNAACDGFRTIAKAESGLWTSYVDANGQVIYFGGQQDPVVFRYRFETERLARRTLRTMHQAVRHCLGTHTADGFLRKYAGLRRVTVGESDALVWRTYQNDTEGFEDHFVEVWALDGTDLVNVRAQKKSSWPSTKRVRKLAKVTVGL